MRFIQDHNAIDKNRMGENYRLVYGAKLHEILLMIHGICDWGFYDILDLLLNAV